MLHAKGTLPWQDKSFIQLSNTTLQALIQLLFEALYTPIPFHPKNILLITKS